MFILDSLTVFELFGRDAWVGLFVQEQFHGIFIGLEHVRGTVERRWMTCGWRSILSLVSHCNDDARTPNGVLRRGTYFGPVTVQSQGACVIVRSKQLSSARRGAHVAGRVVVVRQRQTAAL